MYSNLRFVFSHPPGKSRKISRKRNESSKLTGPKNRYIFFPFFAVIFDYFVLYIIRLENKNLFIHCILYVCLFYTVAILVLTQ